MTKPKHPAHKTPEKKEQQPELPADPKPSLTDAVNTFLQAWNHVTFHSLGIAELKPAVEQLQSALKDT